ncbi:MAG: DNA mismatch repair endonuclease MutH [Enterovibrio sp.]
MIAPPDSEIELTTRAQLLAGQTLGELAAQQGLLCPLDLRRQKGWVGMLLERCLGASAGSKPEQDFAHLGIELKSIPVSYQGTPLETTFVCTAPLTGIHGQLWQDCHLKQKLSRVLWIPIEGEREIPLSERMVGMPLLWQPTPAELAQLQADWEELMELIALGEFAKINAAHGVFLQLRPKAANRAARTNAFDLLGRPIKSLPLGFYLRTQFTQQILARHFILPRG